MSLSLGGLNDGLLQVVHVLDVHSISSEVNLIQLQDLLQKIDAHQKEIITMWVPGRVGI